LFPYLFRSSRRVGQFTPIFNKFVLYYVSLSFSTAYAVHDTNKNHKAVNQPKEKIHAVLQFQQYCSFNTPFFNLPVTVIGIDFTTWIDFGYLNPATLPSKNDITSSSVMVSPL
jgi:hypothetical protein